MNKFVLYVLTPITIAGVLYVFWHSLPSSSDVAAPVFTEFTQPTDPSVDGQVSDRHMTTRLQSGSSITVNNIKLPEYDVGDNLTYVLAGGLDTSNPRYAITYFSNYDFYQISLESEPLAETRLLAETELKGALGIQESDLCDLNVSVRTRIGVNPFFAGQELGVSFCPGSVALE